MLLRAAGGSLDPGCAILGDFPHPSCHPALGSQLCPLKAAPLFRGWAVCVPHFWEQRGAQTLALPGALVTPEWFTCSQAALPGWG